MRYILRLHVYDDLGQEVVVALLGMASNGGILPHSNPVVAQWAWLNKRPILPPSVFRSRAVKRGSRPFGSSGTSRSSCHICILSGRSGTSSAAVMVYRLIGEELSGIGASGYCTDLIRRLDYVLSQLDQRRKYLFPNVRVSRTRFSRTKQEYEEFRRVLSEMEKEAATSYPLFLYNKLACVNL